MAGKRKHHQYSAANRQQRRALRLEAWGHTAAGTGFADAMDVRPPDPPADADARQLYGLGYEMGLARVREQVEGDR